MTLTWAAPTDYGGAALTNFVIQYSSNGGATWLTFPNPTPPVWATSRTVIGLSSGTTYLFQVSAVNAEQLVGRPVMTSATTNGG